MKKINSVSDQGRVRWRRKSRLSNIVDYKPRFTLEKIFKNLKSAADNEVAKLELKRVLYGFGSDRKMNDQAESPLGVQILDLFYRLALAEDFKNIVSQNYMSPLLWYVKSYREFQVALFQWRFQSLDFEKIIVDQIDKITVPDVKNLDKTYKNSDDTYDIKSLKHDCLYNAITLAVCARNAQLLANLYTASCTDGSNKSLDSDSKYERRLFFEQQVIVAVGKAEALYGIHMGLNFSRHPASSGRDVNPGNIKSKQLQKHFKEMFLNYIANDAPTHGWKSVDRMLDVVAPKMFLIHKRIYKEAKILDVEGMKLELTNRLNNRKVKDYRHEYYVHASHQGREEFKGLAKVKDIKKRADDMDLERNDMLKSGGFGE